MGATDILGRLATSIFRQEASAPAFPCCHDVPNGGLLLALPALIVVVLLAIYAAETDVMPDEIAGTLTVRLHYLANRSSGETVRHLCEELNATRTQFPGTDMRLVYELVS